MGNKEKSTVVLTDEQLDSLAQSLLPAMQEFFRSERGKQIWAEHLREIGQDTEKAA